MPIGCVSEEGDDRLVIGRTMMLADKVNGGVMARTFINTTLGESAPNLPIQTSSSGHFNTVPVVQKYLSSCMYMWFHIVVDA